MEEIEDKILSKEFKVEYPCYCFYIFLLNCSLIGSLIPFLVVDFSECWMFCIPFASFFFAIILYIKYHLNKSIEIIRHVYEGKTRVVTRNRLNQKKEIINFPHCNGYFLVNSMTKDWNSHRNRIHIWNGMNIDEELDLEKINLNNTPPKFYWTFRNIRIYDTFEVEKFLRKLVGAEVSYHAKFFGENHDVLKYFQSENFLSYTFSNNIKCFVIIIVIVTLIIIHIIAQKIEKPQIIIMIVFYPLIIISILISVFFHYNKRRLDIFVKDNILFIGITSFTQKSYKKKYIFPLDDIDDWTFPEEKKTSLTIILKNGTSQKICSFSDDEETIKEIAKGLHHLLDKTKGFLYNYMKLNKLKDEIDKALKINNK